MGKPTQKPATIAFDCLAFEQGGRSLVMFGCSAKLLWSVTQVNQRVEEDEKGYQRAVSASRVTKIAQFIDEGNYIPTSVLISFEHAKLSTDKNELIVENRQDAGWVIDGQHRLVGGHDAQKDIILPVVAFTDLSIEEQVSCFVTINREQKGVSSSLYLELLKSLPGNRNPNEDARERAVDLARQLKQDEDSPFYGRIVSTTSPKRGELSLTNFVRKVQPMLKQSTGRLVHFNDDERCKTINNSYNAIRQVFPEEYDSPNSVFFKTVGFGALMGALGVVLDITLSESKKFRISDAAKTFKRIEDFDFSGWRKLSGSGAEAAMAEQLREALMGQARSSDGGTAIDFD
jgi:DGQHR domain-containing protein